MLLLQNHSKNCLKNVITQCQEIPLVKCAVYGYHGMARALMTAAQPQEVLQGFVSLV